LALLSPIEFRTSNSQRHLATQTAYRLLMSESHSIYACYSWSLPAARFNPIEQSGWGGKID
jgi:hypothetical protein